MFQSGTAKATWNFVYPTLITLHAKKKKKNLDNVWNVNVTTYIKTPACYTLLSHTESCLSILQDSSDERIDHQQNTKDCILKVQIA